jgi:hypothetical protein
VCFDAAAGFMDGNLNHKLKQELTPACLVAPPGLPSWSVAGRRAPYRKGQKMKTQKAKLIETWRDDKLAPGGNKRIWIVSHNGQSQIYYTKREARAAKAEIDKTSETVTN